MSLEKHAKVTKKAGEEVKLHHFEPGQAAFISLTWLYVLGFLMQIVALFSEAWLAPVDSL